MLVIERNSLKVTFQAPQAKVSLTDTSGCSHSSSVQTVENTTLQHVYK